MRPRIVDKRILAVLKEYQGVGVSAADMQDLLQDRGFCHPFKVVWENLKQMNERKTVACYAVKAYGLPLKSKLGIPFLVYKCAVVIFDKLFEDRAIFTHYYDMKIESDYLADQKSYADSLVDKIDDIVKERFSSWLERINKKVDNIDGVDGVERKSNL